MRKKDVIYLGGGLIVAGLGGVFLLIDASKPPPSPALWAWLLAWTALVVGVVLVVLAAAWVPIRRHRASRREAREAEEARRASYVPPQARDVAYNEGRWWLFLDRGSESGSGFRCQVFDPLGRDSAKAFGQPGDGPIVLTYPNDFGIRRPLPGGEHTVVWTVGSGEGSGEVARTAFTVKDDGAELTRLRTDLLARRAQGQQLLDDLGAGREFDDWDAHARKWAQELEAYFLSSPHLGRPDAQALQVWLDTSESTPQEQAAASIQHRLDRIDVLVEHFGGEPL